MRNIISLTIALCLSVGLFAQKPKGGYLGRRTLICAEGSYFPNYSSIKDMLLSYNFQYGANVHFITGRYSQTGLSYNMYSLGSHNKYDTSLSNSGRIKGYQIGLTYRKFRESKGGLAPIGKFIDVSLYYHSNEYNVVYEQLIPFAPVVLRTSGISASVGLGAQGIFWNRVVMNSGVRFGYPVFTITAEDDGGDLGDNLEYMKQRLMYKDVFSVFFGIGIIL